MSEFEVSQQSGNKGNANLVYILYLLNFIVPLTALVGVIMAYLGKDEADEVTKSHYINQIHIFWKSMLYGFVGIILSFILIGFLVLLATVVWYIIRVVKGMDKLGKGLPYPDPQSWMF